MERMWIRGKLIQYREGGMKMLRRGEGAEILCVCSGGFQKSVRSRGSA